jgi:hypothetical protein
MSAWGRRFCAACRDDCAKSEFSNSQWLRGVGASRCHHCVATGATATTNGTRRAVLATKAKWERGWAFEGAQRYVGLGVFTDGERAGQQCVRKWFKNRAHRNERRFYENEDKVVELAMRLISSFNDAGLCQGGKVRLNAPKTWAIGDRLYHVELFVKHFSKFNSNTGGSLSTGTVAGPPSCRRSRTTRTTFPVGSSCCATCRAV